jgi:sugar phosphate isomerase/epimerase
MTNRLGIETISAFGMPPVDYVHLAADLGCAYISLGLYRIDINPHGYPPYNLRDDAVLRREMRAALRDRGVSVSLAEGLTIKKGIEARDRASEFDAFAELGATRINTVSLDPDMSRTLDQFAVTVEMATARGMQATTEFAPGLTVADLSGALKAIRHVGQPNFRLLIDTMHLVRSGSSAADLAALDPDLIGYLQLCDAPLVSKFPSYFEEAMTERMIPGEGGLPLPEILKAVRRDCVVSLEVPLLSQAKSGMGPHERLRPAVAAARELLARI